MAKIDSISRILAEDFSEDDRELINQLAFILNPFFEQLSSAFEDNINISDNLSQFIRTFNVTVDSDGKPKSEVGFNNSLNVQLSGMIVIRCRNLEDSGVFPTSGVQISFRETEGLVRVQHITGLQADQQYQLTVLAIGD